MLENKQGKIIIIVGLIALSYIIISHNLSMNNQMRQLRQDVYELQYSFEEISEKLNKIIEMDSIVLNPQYKVENVLEKDMIVGSVTVEFTSNKLGSYEDLMVLYRKTYDLSKPENYDYSIEKWENLEINSERGKYSVDFTVPFSCNYELKIAYKDKDSINYEELPTLDLYTKAEYQFMKDINIYDIKDNKLEFDVQIAKFKSSDNIKLLRAECNIYYDNEIIETVDILKENEIMDRKEPKIQMEHLDGDYWFIIKEIEFDDIKNFDKSKVKIEILLEDSLKNIYKMEREID